MRRGGPQEVLAIVGTGLMGGSLGLAARARGLAERVIGYDLRPEALEAARARGALGEVASSAATAVAGASLVVIATPVGAIPEVFSEIAPRLEPGTIVTDVGSTKGGLVEDVTPLVPQGAAFIGGHPLAGSEKEGIDAADADLYRGCFWILTPTAGTDPGAYRRLVRFLSGLGARVLSLDPSRHDELVALTSHLPQLVASVLMEFADDISSAEGGLPLVTAGGFRDMTRIASSSPELWIDIVRENRRAVLDIVRRFQEALEAAVFSVEAQDWQGLGRTLAAAREARDRLSGKVGLAAKEMFELAVPVPDRPGILAEVTTTIGEAGINIEDIDIVHSPEGGRGTIHLTLAGEEAARRAGEVLERRGFSVSRRRG